MKTISFINIKGGVGKTMSTLSFALLLHNVYNKRVLVVDADHQGNSSKYLGCYSNDKDILSISDLLISKDVIAKDVIQHSKYGVDVIPANYSLMKANKDVLYDTLRPQQFRLKKQLESIADNYDYCIMDLPPNADMASINCLSYSDDVLVPVKFDQGGVDGMVYTLNLIEDIKDFNPKINLKGCFMTMYVRSRLNNEGIEELKKSLGLKFFDTYIRQTTKAGESTFDSPLVVYSPRSTAAQDYRKLLEEYLASEN